MLLSSLIAIAAVLMMGVMSPGPSFIYVARNSLAHSRVHGLVTSLGMGVGAATFALMAMLGLQRVLNAVPELYMALKIAGGAYLIWMAVKIFRGASQPLTLSLSHNDAPKGLWKTFRDGLFIQLSNPKTAIVFASIFTALLPATIPTVFYYVIPLMSFVIDAGWYSLVALLLSAEKPRRVYLRIKTAVDRTSATVLSILGIKLIYSSLVK
ncbi:MULTISPECIES: LysE family translocator [Kosakonia]|uniref:LysE family translocator n=1 Tax=Kosakonia sacchari TaxID=1158459 RepID=A0ABZ0MVP5_9ENTR|nr:LysE family translocator [Kosakonia sacchari]WOZ79564.1 LysE family translocator [Kosakonia sacchari]